MPDAIADDLAANVSPPRDNGEIVFAAPWERRAFGLTVALCRTQRCDWEAFRQRLIARVAEDERRSYWASWAAALEDVLETADAVDPAELDALARAYARRPAGHDHD
jgi:nitrile hydratase accessory protein